MSADIDIDLQTSFDPISLFHAWTNASMVRNDKLTKHNCGVHPQCIPVDVMTGVAAIPFKEAAEIGYDKIDFLHLNLYDHFETREEILALVDLEPDWELLLNKDVQEQLFQLSRHGEVLDKVKPSSIIEVADVLALIRPGKLKLVDMYLLNKNKVRPLLYAPGKDGYAFKKSHAVAYAMVIVLQLHLFDVGIL